MLSFNRMLQSSAGTSPAIVNGPCMPRTRARARTRSHVCNADPCLVCLDYVHFAQLVLVDPVPTKATHIFTKKLQVICVMFAVEAL